MSPFAKLLRTLREKRKLRQKDAAEILGYEQSYLSALETGSKGAPQKNFINRLIMKYELSDDEQNELRLSLIQSKRRFTLPIRTTFNEYEICHALFSQLGNLHLKQIELIKFALELGETNRLFSKSTFITKELEEPQM